MAEKPALHLEELNLKYEEERQRSTSTAPENSARSWPMPKRHKLKPRTSRSK